MMWGQQYEIGAYIGGGKIKNQQAHHYTISISKAMPFGLDFIVKYQSIQARSSFADNLSRSVSEDIFKNSTFRISRSLSDVYSDQTFIDSWQVGLGKKLRVSTRAYISFILYSNYNKILATNLSEIPVDNNGNIIYEEIHMKYGKWQTYAISGDAKLSYRIKEHLFLEGCMGYVSNPRLYLVSVGASVEF